MGKLTICICENKDADQLRGNREADQRLCFRYLDSTIPLLFKSEISSFQPASVTVQPDLCRTCSETTLLVFPRDGSFVDLRSSQQLWSCWDTASILSESPNKFVRLICCFMFQATAMVMSGHCLHFMGFLPNIGDVVMTSKMCLEYNHHSKQLMFLCVDGKPFE